VLTKTITILWLRLDFAIVVPFLFFSFFSFVDL
jgi:hypothetical protein